MSSQNLASWHAAAIGNRSPLRFPLWLCSLVYRRAVDYRNRRYDDRSGVTAVSVPVVSIGNITCGGTGKTPLVIDIARRLEACVHQPAILSRGYGARPGEPNDEERLIRRHLPDTPYLASKNRVEAALAAVDSHGADCLILDDGFQHRRLARDLDIVLIDATDPFGGGFLLPRGLLREPVESIRRAHLVILTRTDQVPPERLDVIVETIQSHAPGVEILNSRHQFAGMQSMAGEPMDMPATPKRFLLVAAIGNPAAFEKTAAGIGVTVADRLWWPDHHQYTDDDVRRMRREAATLGCDAILTTEKDGVKLGRLDILNDGSGPAIHVLGIAMHFEDSASAKLDATLRQVIQADRKQANRQAREGSGDAAGI